MQSKKIKIIVGLCLLSFMYISDAARRYSVPTNKIIQWLTRPDQHKKEIQENAFRCEKRF